MKIVLNKKELDMMQELFNEVDVELKKEGLLDNDIELISIRAAIEEVKENAVFKFNIFNDSLTIEYKEEFIIDFLRLYSKLITKSIPITKKVLEIMNMCKPIISDIEKDVVDFSNKYN